MWLFPYFISFFYLFLFIYLFFASLFLSSLSILLNWSQRTLLLLCPVFPFHPFHVIPIPLIFSYFPVMSFCLFHSKDWDRHNKVSHTFFLRREIKHLHFPSSILLILDQVPPSSNLTRYFQKLLLKQVVSSTRVCIKSCFFSTSYFFKKAVSWWRIFLKDEKKYPSLLPSQISAQWKESSTINKWKRRNPLFLFFLLLWYIHT